MEGRIIPESLYSEIKASMPVPCVDLVVFNQQQEILLLKRTNHPAKGEWWFPGGRVFYLESRRDAAVRKLKEECGLSAKRIREAGAYDLILESGMDKPSHAITTVFLMSVSDTVVSLDRQSETYSWKTRSEWLDIIETPFIREALNNIIDVDEP